MKYEIKATSNDRCNVEYNGKIIMINVSIWYAEKRIKELSTE